MKNNTQDECNKANLHIDHFTHESSFPIMMAQPMPNQKHEITNFGWMRDLFPLLFMGWFDDVLFYICFGDQRSCRECWAHPCLVGQEVRSSKPHLATNGKNINPTKGNTTLNTHIQTWTTNQWPIRQHDITLESWFHAIFADSVSDATTKNTTRWFVNKGSSNAFFFGIKYSTYVIRFLGSTLAKKESWWAI